MDTITVRISRDTLRILRTLATGEGKSATAVLERAVYDYRSGKMLEETNRVYARLKADPVAWAEEQAELRLWENTLSDGLQQHDTFTAPGMPKGKL